MMYWFLKRQLRDMGRQAKARPEFVDALRSTLAMKGYVPTRFSLRGWFLRHLVGFGSALAMMAVGTTGAYAYVSEAVLPDHPLYPVREAIERLEEHAPIPVARVKAKLRANVAQRRVREIQTLLKRHRPLKPKHVKFLKNHPAMQATLAPLLDATTTRTTLIESARSTKKFDLYIERNPERGTLNVERKKEKAEERVRRMQERMERRREKRMKKDLSRQKQTPRRSIQKTIPR